MMTWMVVFLSVTGLWISFYFTGVFYKWLSPETKIIPRVCQLKVNTCQLVLETPRAKMFGIPNSVFGLFVYSYLIVDQWAFPPVIGFILVSFALLRSIYLVYSLVFVTKIPCVLCFTSHMINLILFLIYAKVTWLI